jgi:hypothetical protein
MKKTLLIFTLLCIGFSTIPARTKFVKPKNPGNTVKVLVGNKKYTYFPLLSSDSRIVSVEGPGDMTVYLRSVLPKTSKNGASFTIKYSVDGGQWKSKTFKDLKPSIKARLVKGKTDDLSNLMKLDLKLGRGYHTVKLMREKGALRTLAKVKFVETKLKKESWIEFSPEDYMEPVNIVVREDITEYYRFSKEKPLKVSIKGPTRLRVFTRVENDESMRGRVNYRVQVLNQKKVVNTYFISSRKSEIAEYETETDLVPGKAREFVIKVPEGRHTYQIIPYDKKNPTLLGRLLFPKSDIVIE